MTTATPKKHRYEGDWTRESHTRSVKFSHVDGVTGEAMYRVTTLDPTGRESRLLVAGRKLRIHVAGWDHV